MSGNQGVGDFSLLLSTAMFNAQAADAERKCWEKMPFREGVPMDIWGALPDAEEPPQNNS